MKFSNSPDLVKEFDRLGWAPKLAGPLGITEIICTILYLVPQTSVLGAVLLTGYLGGAIATHVRIDDGFIPPIVMGVMIWLGLFLRDARVRALLPWRS
jgi:xanthine/uracil permease